MSQVFSLKIEVSYATGMKLNRSTVNPKNWFSTSNSVKESDVVVYIG